MSSNLQLRFRVPEGTQLYESLKGLSNLAAKQEPTIQNRFAPSTEATVSDKGNEKKMKADFR